MVKIWVTRGGKQSDRISAIESEIESLERKEAEIRAELKSIQESIFEKQNELRELQDEQAKQDLLD